jgi:hypothetical protein
MRTIAEYISLFTSQYQNSTKLKDFAALLMQPFKDASDCALALDAAFDLDTAIGDQLDILGLWIGLPRTLPFVPTSYFNAITNGDMETWTVPTLPDGWTLGGAGTPAVAKEGTTKHGGTYSAKLTVSAGSPDTAYIEQIILNDVDIAQYKGKTVTLGAWVYAAVASKVRIEISDEITFPSSFHTGNSTWEYLTVDIRVDSAATQITAFCAVSGANNIAYFDDVEIINVADPEASVMEDSVYRQALKAQIAINTWDGQLDSIGTIWNELFPYQSISIVDNLDMTIAVTFTDALPNIFQNMLSHEMLIPRPQGVGTNFTFANVPHFGFDLNTDEVKGFDEGYWA